MDPIDHKDLTGAALHLPGPHTHNAQADLTGMIAISQIATGTPDGTKFVRDDGVLAVPDSGAVGLLSLDDHFTAGGSGSSTVGELGWLFSLGSVAYQNGELGHPGILQRATGATSGVYAPLYLQNSNGGPLIPAESFDCTFVLRLNQTDNATICRAGLGAGASTNPPTHGLYVEKLAGDTSWFGVTRIGNAQTRTAAVAACSTGWVVLRIRRIDAGTIGFSIDGGTEVTATLTIPTAALNPFAAIGNAAAASKTLDIDRFTLVIP